MGKCRHANKFKLKCYRQNPFIKILIKTVSCPGETAGPHSISTTCCCGRPTFIIRVFCAASNTKKKYLGQPSL